MPSPEEDLLTRRAAVALFALCRDYGEVEGLAHMLRTFPCSYRLPVRLVERLSEVGSRLWDLHDDDVK